MSGGCVAVGSSDRGHWAIYLASFSRLSQAWAPTGSRAPRKAVRENMRSQLRTRHPHFHHILLATASHKTSSDPRNEEIDSTPWWENHQSHIAKGVDSGRGGQLSAMPTSGRTHNINQVKSKNWFCCNYTHLCILIILCTELWCLPSLAVVWSSQDPAHGGEGLCYCQIGNPIELDHLLLRSHPVNS